MATPNTPLWEVFIRSRNGLAHKHVGSLHATDATLALQAARDIYTRRGEGLSIWVVPSSAITASDPADKEMLFEPTASKIYRHPTFYKVPDDVGNMFQIKRDCNDAYCGNRDLELAHRLNPEMQTLDSWLAINVGRVPLG